MIRPIIIAKMAIIKGMPAAISFITPIYLCHSGCMK
jgi:hypothetical protein